MVWPNMIEAQYKNNVKHEIFWYKPKQNKLEKRNKRNMLVQNEKNKLKKRKKRKCFSNIKTKTNFESRKTQKNEFE